MIEPDDITADQDIEQEADAPDEIVIEHEDESDGDVHTAPPVDLDPVLEKELRKVLVEEEPIKTKAQQISEDIIKRPLTMEDLFDDGSI